MASRMAWVRAALFVILVSLLPAMAAAQVDLRFVTADQSAQPGRPTRVALRIEHQPGWHTYWINAGIGEPTKIEWKLPEGWRAGGIEWPTPTAIEDANRQITGQGYSDLLLLPVTLQVPPSAKAGATAEIRAHIKWVMCSEVCIPGEKDLSFSLPISNQPPVASAAIRAELAGQPMPISDGRWKAEASTSLDGVVLKITAPEAISDVRFFSEDLFIPGDGPQGISGAPGKIVTLALPVNADAAAPSTLKGIVGFKDGQGRYQGVNISTSLATGPAAGSLGSASSTTGLGILILLGFLGGLILNLMPCVFPVLSIKILGFVEQAQNDRRGVTMHGFAFTAGVLVSFWVLVAVLESLRAGGATLGWGFQLQSPAFVYSLALVMLVFALSLSGVFEFGLRAMRVGSGLQSKSGYWGSALTGVLATIVATPCSAPFLAPALGAALTLPPHQSFLVFTFIGLGLSAPYLLLSMFPSAIRFLPRPGPWMVTLRQLLAFPLYATVAWLMWVLAGQVSEGGLLMALFGLVVVAMGIWLYGRYQPFDFNAGKGKVAAAAAFLLLLGGAWLGFPRPAPPQEMIWEPWSEARVAELRKEGRPIYVDFTARWCATCQTNKKLVFGSDRVREKMRALNVALLKADWTNSDPAITKELAKWSRSAVPFNLIYLPGQAEPKVMPELLTPAIVLDALPAEPKG